MAGEYQTEVVYHLQISGFRVQGRDNQPSRSCGNKVFLHFRLMNRSFYRQLLVSVLAASSICAQAEDRSGSKKAAATSGELFETIARMDATIFDAFNVHDVDRLMALFTEDLEFYHDADGLTNYTQSSEGFQKLFASTPDIRRDLVKGTLEVYPIKNLGALEIGQHRFCHKEKGKNDCGTFKFAMIWRKSGDSWKLSRVISYGH